MIGPEEEKIPRRVEKEPFQGEALVRHEHGVHLARDRMHELRVDAHIRAAPDRGREGVGIRAKDLDLRRGKGLRQGHLAHRAKLRPARAFFIRAMHGVHGDQHALGGRIAVMGRIFTDAARGRIRRGIALLGAKVKSFMYQSEGTESRRLASDMLDCLISSTSANSTWVRAFVA